MKIKKYNINTLGLAMLITGAVDGVSNLPSIALFGQQLVFFFFFASLLFLLPVGMVSAELCHQFKQDGGVYLWAKKAFGEHFGVLTIWLQWINTMVWFPTCLMTLAGTAAYLINPQLIHHPTYLVITSLSVFWIMTLLNLKGIKRSTFIASIATTLGMVIPMCLIIGLSFLWVYFSKPLAIHLSHTAIFPPLLHHSTWTSLTAIITSFLGIELATVHVNKIKHSRTIFPKALLIAILVIILTMGVGSLSVALVVPHQHIALVAGTIEAFNTLFQGFHLPFLEKALGATLLFGSLGAMINWLISPANGLAQAAKDGFLPKRLAQENQHGVPAQLLLLQGVVVSLVSLVFFLMPSINGSYWLLLDLSTEVYVIMYLLMFITALKLFCNSTTRWITPGGKKIAYSLTTLGLLGCIITLVIGFIPPHNVDVGSPLHYILLFSTGLCLLISPAFMLIRYKKMNIVI